MTGRGPTTRLLHPILPSIEEHLKVRDVFPITRNDCNRRVKQRLEEVLSLDFRIYRVLINRR